jgi:hypothetical protein
MRCVISKASFVKDRFSWSQPIKRMLEARGYVGEAGPCPLRHLVKTHCEDNTRIAPLVLDAASVCSDTSARGLLADLQAGIR